MEDHFPLNCHKYIQAIPKLICGQVPSSILLEEEKRKAEVLSLGERAMMFEFAEGDNANDIRIKRFFKQTSQEEYGRQ